KELRERTRAAVGVGLSVGSQDDRRDRDDAGRVARHDLLPGLSLPARQVEPSDLCGQLAVAEDEQSAALLSPADDLVVVGESRYFPGLAAFDRIDVGFSIAARRRHEPAISRNRVVTVGPNAFAGDRPRRSPLRGGDENPNVPPRLASF